MLPDMPRVLLGNLEPIVRLGMVAVLEEDGAEVIGHEKRPQALVLMAERLQPDLVVLDLHERSARELAARVRAAAPDATVVLWTRDEDAVELLDPGATAPRRPSGDPAQALLRALRGASAPR